MKILFFIINIKAGNGASVKIWDRLKKELDKQDVNYRSFYTKYPGHAVELAKQIGSMFEGKIEAVIAVGGDGTVHEVINGLVEYPTIKMGYIPAGSGNDFSRGFSVPTSYKQALSFILKNKEKKGTLFDIGKFKVGGLTKHHFFVSSLGAGFDAAVAKLTNESKMKKYLNKIRLGSLAYVGAVIRLLFSYQVTKVRLVVDNEVYEYDKVWLVTVSNQRFYGGGMKIAPKASTTDGRFDITVVHNLSRSKLLFVFGTVFLGKHTGLKEVAVHTGERIRIESDLKMYVHADGEISGNTPVQITVEHKKMPFLVKGTI